jgi:hypothetical protein
MLDRFAQSGFKGSRDRGKNLKKKMKNVEQGMLIYEGEQRNGPFGEWAI